MSVTTEKEVSEVSTSDPWAEPASADRTRRISRRAVVVWMTRIGVLAALIAGWQLFGTSSPARELVFSTPGAVVESFWVAFSEGEWGSALFITLQEAVLGFLLGVTAAVVLVAIIVPVPLLARFVAPFVAAANALPIVVLAPMFIVWFGISLQSKVYFVSMAIFFIIFHGLYAGLGAIDKSLVDNARLLGARRFALVKEVYAPAVLTWVIAGLRLSSAWALLAAVVAEYLGANQGIGYEIASAQQQLRTDDVVAGLLLVAVIAVILDRALVRFEAHVSRWRVF
ncbi:ABC transporter permease [Rhodococcus sp. NPDC057529]|uniref:ABC transporter permease n=1 Tax=Rhodococcus sp. NPDC057529 TaxID=3346158 RepID=UPI003670B3DA